MLRLCEKQVFLVPVGRLIFPQHPCNITVVQRAHDCVLGTMVTIMFSPPPPPCRPCGVKAPLGRGLNCRLEFESLIGRKGFDYTHSLMLRTVPTSRWFATLAYFEVPSSLLALV